MRSELWLTFFCFTGLVFTGEGTMSQEVILNKVSEIADPIIEELGLELVDIEFISQGSEWLLRLFIDKPGGVNLDDCAEFSRELSTILDVEEVIEMAYRLEVSSPGIDRPLKKAADFERFKGEMVRAKTFEAVDPDMRGYKRKTFIGTLLGLEQGIVAIEQNDKAGGRVDLPLDSLEAINLEPQF
ncbi:MAG: ribosome maturation factor [Desulfuromonas sp.]|nr:MAG: ribosome maturation factor [Desulfuromonas sp.]